MELKEIRFIYRKGKMDNKLFISYGLKIKYGRESENNNEVIIY